MLISERRKCKDTFKRERVKLKKFAVKLDNHELTYKMIDTQYKSWRGTIKRNNGKMFKNQTLKGGKQR